jgi:phage shock protein PspC (stress-responsive transcriptional regulator)
MMEKTIKINLAGILFQIDEEAYRVLREYLQAVNNRFRNVPGGNETIEDIESRIAEIFQSQQNLAGVVSIENVEAMIGIIGKPEDFDHVENPEVSTDNYSNRRRLYRNPDNTIISGVCGGIGGYLNIDPVWVRMLFILFSLFYGVGFFVYLALWIALPKAISDIQKRELFGVAYRSESYREKSANITLSNDKSYQNRSNDRISRVGNTFNEIFRAVGNGFYIFFRVILIILGLSFVLAGFVSLLAFIAAFFFRYPGFISMNTVDANLFYLPDFLNLMLNPSVTTWVMIFTSVIVVLPLLALIYWGVKMIFWFRVRDGIVSLIALILWLLSISALVLILFNQGISFAETGSKTARVVIDNPPDTLYLKVNTKISDLKFDKEITMPGGDYSLYINESQNEIFSRPQIRLMHSENRAANLDIRKQSNGRIRKEAVEKAESFIYNYKVSNDTIYLDEYYNIPVKYKWTGADIHVNLAMPVGMVIWVDKNMENIFPDYVSNGIYSWELGNKYWIWTEEGLVESPPAKVK